MAKLPLTLPQNVRGPSADPGPLTNNISAQTVDGTLADCDGIGTVSVANVETNFSELAAKYESLRQVLLEQGLIE